LIIGSYFYSQLTTSLLPLTSLRRGEEWSARSSHHATKGTLRREMKRGVRHVHVAVAKIEENLNYLKYLPFFYYL
jgi:hypothetical protein